MTACFSSSSLKAAWLAVQLGPASSMASATLPAGGEPDTLRCHASTTADGHHARMHGGWQRQGQLYRHLLEDLGKEGANACLFWKQHPGPSHKLQPLKESSCGCLKDFVKMKIERRVGLAQALSSNALLGSCQQCLMLCPGPKILLPASAEDNYAKCTCSFQCTERDTKKPKQV